MKIEGFETRLAAPSEQFDPTTDGPGCVVANFVTLKLHTSAGIDGVGYGGFVSKPMLKTLREAMSAVAQQAVGSDPMRVEEITERLLRVGGSGAPAGMVTRAVAAVDVALWDIKGKALGQPLHKLLGGYRQSVDCYASGFLWRTYDPDSLANTGARLVESGFKAMKFRMGGEDSLAVEIDRMDALREAVGDDIELMVDINQGWDVNTAIRAGRAMEKRNLYWLEDPIHHQDYEGMAKIANALDTPIATGEYHYGMMPFRHMFERQCVDISMIDLLRAGGITTWMKIAHLSEAFSLPVVSHLAPEILAHCVAAIPNGLTVEHMPWSLLLFEQDLELSEGKIVLSDRPGLGLDFDDDALRQMTPS